MQVLSTQVDAQRDKLATVVSRQFITLNVHLCVNTTGVTQRVARVCLRQRRLVQINFVSYT